MLPPSDQPEFITTETDQTSPDKTVRPSRWKTEIPVLNCMALVISLFFIFIVDIPIIRNSPELTPYFNTMLKFFAAFVIFFGIETFLFRAIFGKTRTNFIDTFFVLIIVVRNGVFILNFIPFIQLIGVMLAKYVAIPYILIYLSLLWVRLKDTKSMQQLNH